MLRQLILFVPAMLLLPKVFGETAVWWAEPVVDFTMLVMQQRELFKMKQLGVKS